MNRIACIVLALAIIVPASVQAKAIQENDVGAYESGGEKIAVAPKKKDAPAEGVGSAETPPAGPPHVEKRSEIMLDGRKGSFRVGAIGPGFAVANRGIGAMMNLGIEGEYFFFERLSAGMQIDLATEFDDYAILSFLPYARYVFDLNSHPRWSFYVQAGVGPALVNGDHVAADIAIPGGGFWWQWTEKLSVGADAWFHIFVRDNTAVGFTISPAIRYQF